MNNSNLPKSKIIKLDGQLQDITAQSSALNDELSSVIQAQAVQRARQNDLMAELDALAAKMQVNLETHTSPAPQFAPLDLQFEEFYSQKHTVVKRFPALTTAEWIYASVAGIISVAIDVIFVGTPEIVKVYKGGENFDGSKLTALLRKIGSDPESNSYAVLHWLSDKCKVPYDLSAVKDVMYPNNHRVRSLGHDPMLGLFFAVADILMGTTTCIDNAGHIRVLLNKKHEADMEEKLLAVFYYIGHIFSDMCTARGIPVPGFFLTQFFTDGKIGSLANIAGKMYQDGYDLRHMASMSVPVMVKDLLIEAYMRLNTTYDDIPSIGIAESELALQNYLLKKEKMLFISDCIATGGNLGKILLPPSCGNPASINLPQWAEFIRGCITMAKAATRDMSVETVIAQRKDIDDTWQHLLEDY